MMTSWVMTCLYTVLASHEVIILNLQGLSFALSIVQLASSKLHNQQHLFTAILLMTAWYLRQNTFENVQNLASSECLCNCTMHSCIGIQKSPKFVSLIRKFAAHQICMRDNNGRSPCWTFLACWTFLSWWTFLSCWTFYLAGRFSLLNVLLYF